MHQHIQENWNGVILPAVKDVFQTKLGIEGQLANNALYLFPDNLGPDSDGSALIEVGVVSAVDEYDENNSFVNIFTIVAKDVAAEHFEAVSRRLDKMNFSALLGFWGLNDATAEIYHKNLVLIRETEPEAFQEYLVSAIRWSLVTADANYEAVLAALG